MCCVGAYHRRVRLAFYNVRLYLERFWRHRVMAARAPWLTSPDSFQGQPGSDQRAMVSQGFDGIGRATWLKTATCERPKSEPQHWRNQPLIEPHAENQDMLRNVHWFRRIYLPFFRLKLSTFPFQQSRFPKCCQKVL